MGTVPDFRRPCENSGTVLFLPHEKLPMPPLPDIRNLRALFWTKLGTASSPLDPRSAPRETDHVKDTIQVMALEILATLKALSQGVQAIAGMAKAANQVEFNNKLIEVQGLILELQSKVGTLQEDNFGLKRSLEESEAKFQLKSALTVGGNAYWNGCEGPFCTYCQDAARALVRLRYMGSGGGPDFTQVPHTGYWEYYCDIHKINVCLYPPDIPKTDIPKRS